MMQGSERLKVLHLIEHLNVGGAERVVSDIVRHLDSASFQSTVLLYRGEGPIARTLSADGFTVRRLPKGRIGRRLVGVPGLLCAPIALGESIPFLIGLRRTIRELGVDLVHSHMFSANLWGSVAAAGTGCGVVLTEHTRWNRCEGLKRRIGRRLMLPRCDRIVAVSRSIAAQMAEAPGFPGQKLRVIPNGVDVGLFRPQAPPPEKGYGKRSPSVLLLGRLVAAKRVDLFLDAMRICADRIPSVVAMIAGEGPLRASLEARAGALGLSGRVKFLGRRADVGALLARADVVVNASDREGLPVSLMEAMAAGCPVVATDVGGTGELVIDNRTGILVKPGDAAGLAEGVCRLLTAPETARRLAGRGVERVRDAYSVQRNVRLWEALYREVVAERRVG